MSEKPIKKAPKAENKIKDKNNIAIEEKANHEESWLEEIIFAQEDDLFEEDTLLDKIPNKLAEFYRDEDEY